MASLFDILAALHLNRESETLITGSPLERALSMSSPWNPTPLYDKILQFSLGGRPIGRTAAFGAADPGSSPGPRANETSGLLALSISYSLATDIL